MTRKLTLNIRSFLLIISLVMFPVVAFGHGGGLNALACHNNKKIGGYHCHQGSNSSSSLGSLKSSMNEDFYNIALARKLNGKTEVTFEYAYGRKGNTPLTASIRVDIVTDGYVIEGGKDKRSSLDSIQQAVFASTLSGKEPAVAIYDTDGRWGKYEHRVWAAAKELGVKFIWFSDGEIIDLE
ncbi:hypothetical protein N9E28_02740 [Alphaproteobacteria bacterium]|nr:hypothetical protein [Alphaproteobacteria bacterium]